MLDLFAYLIVIVLLIPVFIMLLAGAGIVLTLLVSPFIAPFIRGADGEE